MEGSSEEFDVVDFIMEFETSDDMDEEKIIKGFQAMLEKGVLFKMQGFYGRKGKELLDRGLIKIPDGMEVVDCYGNEVIPNPKSYEAY